MLNDMLGNADRHVVVDVETTRLCNSDRVVEVAAVTVHPNGRIVDEWDYVGRPAARRWPDQHSCCDRHDGLRRENPLSIDAVFIEEARVLGLRTKACEAVLKRWSQ